VVRNADGTLTPVRLAVPAGEALDALRAAAGAVLGGEARTLRWLDGDAYVQWESGDAAVVMGYSEGRFVGVDLASCTIPSSSSDGGGRGAPPQKRARRRR